MEYEQILQSFKLLQEYQEIEIKNSRRLLEVASELQNFIESSTYKPAYNGGLLDIIGGIGETLTSKVIANIFSYQDDNKRFILLESFIEKLLDTPLKVSRPTITAEKERLDVAIKDKGYAIIIENKLHNAPFQRNQLARYIKRLKENYKENDIYLVILPQYRDIPIRLSVGRLPENYKEPDCAIGKHECWCDDPTTIWTSEMRNSCSKCDTSILGRLQKNTVKLHDDYSEWLIKEAEKLPLKQWPLKSCMLQFAYYLKGLYNTRFSDKLNMAIIEFLKEKLMKDGSLIENFEKINETILEIDQLKNAVSRLKGQIAIDLVKNWGINLKKKFPNIVSNLDTNGVYSFGLLFQGIWIGCWSGTGKDNDNQPYWGFFSEEPATRKQQKMIELILQECCLDEEIYPDNNFKVWANTMDGDIICKNFYEIALDLGYR